METQNENQHEDFFCKRYEKEHKRGKIIGGILVVIAGSLLLARELGVELPHWVFSWKTLLIALGIFIGIKHNFRHIGWLVMVLIGGAFIVSDIYPEFVFKHFLWPILLIVAGLFIIFKPRKRHYNFKKRFRDHHQWKKWHEHYEHHRQPVNDPATAAGDQPQWKKGQQYEQQQQSVNEPLSDTNSDDVINGVAFMGGIKKKIISKNFKGGDITVIFGGVELNFAQADIQEKATLEITQLFGGAKLIVPSNWEIKSELVSVFGSIEDKRLVESAPLSSEASKVLILRGTTIFGGIEIKSF